MALRITCPQGHVLNVKESARGKKVRCPTCQTLMKVGGAPTSTQASPKPASPKPAAQTAKKRPAQTESSRIVVKCPTGHQLKLKSELMGKKVRCPKCHETFTVAKASSTAAPAAAKPAPASKTPASQTRSKKTRPTTDASSPTDPLFAGPLDTDPLSPHSAEQQGNADWFADIPTFDDAPGFDEAPALDTGQDFDLGKAFDNLPGMDADPFATGHTAPANFATGVSAAGGMMDAHSSFPGQTPAAAAIPIKTRSTGQKPSTAAGDPALRVPWIALAAGIATGLVLLAGEGFLLFGLGSKEGASKNVVAKQTVNDASAASEPHPGAAQPGPEVRAEMSPASNSNRETLHEDEVKSTMVEKLEGGPQDESAGRPNMTTQPILEEIKLDANPYLLEGSGGNRSLPTKTRSVVYDTLTGRIALTLDSANGKRGAVVVYEMDKLMDGPTEPVAIFETPHLPTAVTIKPWQGKRLFAVACERQAEVWLYDVDTLQPAGQILTGGPEIIDVQSLGSSRDPNDPFLYFAAVQSYERNGSPYKDNVIGRLNVSTMEIDSKTEPAQRGNETTTPDGLVAVSADGSTLFGKDASYHYEKLPGDGTEGRLTALHKLESRFGFRSTPGPFGVQTLSSFTLCSRDLFVTDNTGVLLLASGEQNAILMGVEMLHNQQPIDPKGRLKIVSANNYEELAAVDFTQDLFKGVLWGFLDETRKLAIVTTNGSLYVWRDLLQDVPQEPWLTVTAAIPDQVVVGQEISVPLQTPSGADVTFELIDESPYYVEEEKEAPFDYQVSYRDSLTFSPFATYSIPDDVTLTGDIDIFVLLQTPDGQWTRKTTLHETVFRDLNDDGKVNRTDDESNPDRKVVAVATVTANNDMTVTFTPISDAIRSTLQPNTDGAGRIYRYCGVSRFRAAVCLAQSDDPSDIIPITKVSNVKVGVTDTVAIARGRRNAFTSGAPPRPKPKPPLRNKLSQFDFRNGTQFVSAKDSSIAIKEGTLTWTPSAQQIGKLSLGIRARSGSLVKDTYFGVDVTLGGSSETEALPFYVNGISFQRDSDLAVIWGNDSEMDVVWRYNKKSSKPSPGIKYMVGVYDWRQGKVLRHEEVPVEIDFAGISPSGICATISDPPRLVRFDHQTLKPVKQVPLQTQALRLVVVADKYVATTAYANGERFKLPSLQPIQSELPVTSTWLAEDFGDGWMWEGVHWDKAMREAKLLAMPIAFGVGPDPNKHGHIAGFEKAARIESSGPVLLTLHDTISRVKGLPIPTHPCRLSVQRDNASVIGEMSFEYNQKERKVIVPSSQAENPNARGQAPLFVAHGPEHSAAIVGGKIRMIPYSLWDLPEIGFNFQPVQSTFLLNPSQPTDVQYSAPDAVKYRLRLMSGYTHRSGGTFFSDSNAKVLFEAESTDGSFEIAFESVEPLINAARKIAGIDDSYSRNRNLSPDQLEKRVVDALVAYRKQVTDSYRNLTGRAPRKTPVPVYAYVTAENAAREKAVLFHAYLVDIDTTNHSFE